ncbi:MAG: putative Ig domain-containing protein [Bryobacteraceae bacterium]
MPDPVTLRAGQKSLTFSGSTKPRIAPGVVTITATLFAKSTQTSVTIQGTSSPAIAVPGTLTSVGGTAVEFEVAGYDPTDTPVTLSATKLPPGALFDSVTGEFSWDPGGAPTGTYPVEFAAMNGLGLSSSSTVEVEVVPGEPALDKLIHGATRKHEGACSPGSLATLRGTGLGKEVQLSINGEPATVIAGSAREMTFQCPDLDPGTTLYFQAKRGMHSSNTLDSIMADAAPGIFSLDGSGGGQGIALLGDTGKVLMLRSPEVLSQPATRQDLISLLATGLGREAFDSPNRVHVLLGRFVVTAESITAAAPGIWQVVVRVPEEAPLGDAVPLRLVLARPGERTVDSNLVSIALEARNPEDR